jgi:MFS family permease
MKEIMDRQKDANFTRNVGGVGAVEFFWGLGFPIVMESTFLQLFLKKLGASSFAIGIVPSLFILGISIAPLFAAYLSYSYVRKKPLVAALHVISGLAVFLFGAILHGLHDPDLVLAVFFATYLLFSLCLGLAIPVWLDYVTRIFSERRTVPGLGYMMLAQNLGKIVASVFILKVVDAYAFSLNSSAWVFMATGGVFVFGSVFFIFTKEVVEEGRRQARPPFFRHTWATFNKVIADRPFLVYLAGDLDVYVILTALSFYANYATGFFQVPAPVAAGVFVAFIYAGSITVNILFGAMNLLGLKEKLYLSKGVTLTLLCLLIFIPHYWTFFLISYLLGVGRAIRNMVYPPSVKKFVGRGDATGYYAMASLLILPVGSGLPLIFGRGLDLLSHLGADAYRLLFGFCALFVLATLYFTVKTDYSRSGAE